MTINLRQITMFSQLPEQALAEVIAALVPGHMAAGEILFNQGDPGDELIIVESGRLAIYIPLPGAPEAGQPIRLFQAGELLGEMAVVDRKPRSTSARAEEPSNILSLKGADFQKLLVANPEMALSVMAGLSDRIRYTTDFLGEVRGWVARMAEGNYQTRTLVEEQHYQDQTLATLAGEFARMAARVQEREETLRREVAQLRIEIDQAKRKQESERIIGSDYYQRLKEKANNLRNQNQGQ